MKKYLKKWRPDAVPAAKEFDIVIIDDAENMQGPYNRSDPDYYTVNLEGNLDAQTVLGLIYPTPLIAYNTGGYDLSSVYSHGPALSRTCDNRLCLQTKCG